MCVKTILTLFFLESEELWFSGTWV